MHGAPSRGKKSRASGDGRHWLGQSTHATLGPPSLLLPSLRNMLLIASRTSLARAARLATPRSYASSAKPTYNRSSAAAPKPPKPAQDGSEKLGTTSAADLHPLPSYVEDAARPSSDASQPRVDASGNSVSAADISSRPSGPGPSSPPTDAARAAPGFAGNAGASDPSNWTSSFSGMSTQPFPKEVAEILEAPINEEDVEIKPGGILYLPEIKYRRILNRAFGPGGWGLAPRSETNVAERIVSREWALVCLGRWVEKEEQEAKADPSLISFSPSFSLPLSLSLSQIHLHSPRRARIL